MIVTVCADKGSPGVSTTAMVLGMVWPGERLLLEADPSGGDAALRLRTPAGQWLARTPTVHALCVDARSGQLPRPLPEYAHPTSAGLPVIPATDLSSANLALVAGQWKQVAAIAADWSGTVIADLGRLQENNTAGSLALSSDVVLLIARPTPAGLLHLRGRAAVLIERLGQGGHGHSPLAVALICPAKAHAARLVEARALLAADPASSSVPVVGWLAEDPRSVANLDAGRFDRRLERGDLLSSARALASGLIAQWPELTPAAAAASAVAAEARASGDRFPPPPAAPPSWPHVAPAMDGPPPELLSPVMTRGGWRQ